MAEALTTNWTPLTILGVMVVGLIIWFRETQKRADERQERRDEFLQEMIVEMRRERRADVEAMQALVRQNGEAQHEAAQALNGLCAALNTHEGRSADRHQMLVELNRK